MGPGLSATLSYDSMPIETVAILALMYSQVPCQEFKNAV